MQPCLFDFSFIWHAVTRLNGFTSKHHRKAVQKLVRHILLELPLRMSSSKHRNSFIQKSFRLTGCPFLNGRNRKSGLHFDFPVVVSAALTALNSRARGLYMCLLISYLFCPGLINTMEAIFLILRRDSVFSVAKCVKSSLER